MMKLDIETMIVFLYQRNYLDAYSALLNVYIELYGETKRPTLMIVRNDEQNEGEESETPTTTSDLTRTNLNPRV